MQLSNNGLPGVPAALYVWIKPLFTAGVRRRLFLSLCLLLLLYLVFLLIPLKQPLFGDAYSTVIKDRNGVLLGAHIADDSQWRFPPLEQVPEKFKKCIILFEDAGFYSHPGVDLPAIFRALYLNLKQGRVVSGGSTLTMQVIRLSRKGKPRILWEKIIEALLAFKLEFACTKEAILALYASHAPFGGNTVGIEAAAWRYFGRTPDNLSWAESALLAVLPNNPSLLHLGQNRPQLLEKRNRLLDRLYEKSILKKEEWELALEESLPAAPHPIPQLARHLLMRAMQEEHKGRTVHTSVDKTLQEQVTGIIARHYKVLSAAHVNNAAALVLKTGTGEVLAYAGNTVPLGEESFGNAVDIVTAPRSTGSLLKPFLYAFMLDEGLLLPGQLVPDIPLFFKEFAPRNSNNTYQGALPADEALSRSLNVPFVYLLREYNYQKFYDRMRRLGMTFTAPASHYGLSLIIGGAECSLWTLTGMYAGLARVLKHYAGHPVYAYSDADYFPNTYLALPQSSSMAQSRARAYTNNSVVGAAAIWFAFRAMVEVARPGAEREWERFSSARQIAWKTGTSFGNRDAWAIGISPDYVVGVWVGNADGEGRPEIKGSQAAGPVLFDIFDLLPVSGWFAKPVTDMRYIYTCKKSGLPAGVFCDDKQLTEVPAKGITGLPCPYHQLLHLDAEGKFQVDSSFYPVSKMQHKSWFVLPPVEEYYYKRVNSTYVPVPPVKHKADQVMEFIYPYTSSRFSRVETKIYVPIELDGKPGECVFELAHRKPDTVIYWHLDGNYAGATRNIHQMGFNPPPGIHELVVIDEQGQELIQRFEIVPRIRGGSS